MHLARGLTGLSFRAIGAYFGGRDPATVRHACKAAADRLAADPALAAAVEGLRQKWRGPTTARVGPRPRSASSPARRAGTQRPWRICRKK